jgi:anti-sigma regulatory factor (Ser/Thr protein kinase)
MTSAQIFRCQPEAVPAARRFVREQLRGQSAAVLEAAELMTSELVTNCVRHARTDFELSVRPGEEVRVEVRDSGDGRPVPRSPGARDASGRGLRIVEAMSDEWGVIDGASGKTVWFSLRDAERADAPAGAAAEDAASPAGDASPAAATAVVASSRAPGEGGGAAEPSANARAPVSRSGGTPRPSPRRSPAGRWRATSRPCTPAA